MAPHLLTLPREIRDNIYQYLHHRVQLTCLVDEDGEKDDDPDTDDEDPDTDDDESDADDEDDDESDTDDDESDTDDDEADVDDDKVLEIQVTVDRAPIVDVMLVHPRIYEEYRESILFKNYSATFNATAAPHMVLPLNRQLTSSLGPILPHLRHATLLFERNTKNALMINYFARKLYRVQGMRSFTAAYRKSHRFSPRTVLTVADVERCYLDVLPQKYEGYRTETPPPGMTLIQQGRACGFNACGCGFDHFQCYCGLDHLQGHCSFYFQVFASRSGDERYLEQEDVLSVWPLLRGGRSFDHYLSMNPNMTELELNSVAMQRLRKMPLWKELRKDISSDVSDSITKAYLGGKDYIFKATVAKI